ncbi:MAG: C-terminal binding protein [Candidatus Nealsonbacteria bacterium]|nr:MAG: C-terminal binding protein [Candidatus Nealsonbacteria bacterium]
MLNKKIKVVITDCNHPSIEIERKMLSEINAELILSNCNTEEDIIKVAKDADGIINQRVPITRRVITLLNKCKVIVRYGVGVDNIDVKAATECGIIVSNVPDYCVDEVSTHAIALILNCARGISLLDRKIREEEWGFTLAKPLFRTQGKTLGIYGLGRIGSAVAKKSMGFGLKIIAYDPYVSKVNNRIKMVDFPQLLSESDFISINASLTDETWHAFKENELKAMKKTAYLINTARGSIVDERVLYKALREGWIAGAAVDVMEKEPPDWDNPLLKLDNVVFTPHSAFYSEESYIELKTKVAEAVISVLSGRLPKSIMNPEVIKKIIEKGYFYNRNDFII